MVENENTTMEKTTIENTRNIVKNAKRITEKVTEFADLVGLPIVGKIPRSDEITRCEDKGMTVIEGEPDSPAAQAFLKLAQELLENAQDTAEEEVW